jgi:pimeloyl-ACP methyl ester carboxylesterase
VASTAPDLSTPQTNRDRALARMVSQFERLVDEVEDLEPGLRTPMVILTAGEAWWGRDEIDAAWRASHEATAAAAPGRSLRIVEDSRHMVPVERPDAILDAVQVLLRDLGLPSSTGEQEHEGDRERQTPDE